VTSVVTTIRRGVNSSRAVKVPCIAATTANITLSGEQTIDGVACVAGNRVLVKDQTDASENGIYAVDTSAWGREPDWDGTYDVVKGTYVYVSGGTVGNNFWQVTTADPITIGTTDVALQATDPDSLLRTNLADTSTGQGASLVGVEDSASNFTGATVEAVLAEIIADYAATTNGNGASKIGIEDAAARFTATQVEAALAEIMTKTLTKGADVASANALTLGADGNYFDITGTTAITSIGTLGVGRIVKLHFDGALTLTHHATDLVLPGAANITTAAGDEAEFFEYATGDWRCTNYQYISSIPVIFSEGTWTPTIQDTTFSDAEGQTYTAQIGRYSRVGSTVTITGTLIVAGFGTLTTSSTAYIGGLPFTAENTSNYRGGVNCFEGLTLAITATANVSGEITANTARIELQKWDNAAGVTALLLSELTSNGVLSFQGSYSI